MFLLVVFYSVLVTVADITSAWLFASDPTHWGIDAIRGLRDSLLVLLALWGGVRAMGAGLPVALGAAYMALIGIYTLASPDGVDMSVVLASAAKLALPVLLVAVGFGGVDTPRRLQRYALVLAALAVASTLFGAWDVRHTEFWTETLLYGHFLNQVKGIVTGFDGYYVLPFNFFGFEETRRAGGLVAAPLAQGSLVAIGTVLGFAALQRRAFVPALLLLLVGIMGVWQSGTRGAMLFLLIALPLFLVLAERGGAMLRNVVLLAGLLFAAWETLYFVYSYSVNLEDGSTIGHLDALKTNLADLDQVVLLGPGVGASGAAAADAGLPLAGGGEGAIFAIAYQIGLPGMFLFLAYYSVLLVRILPLRHRQDAAGDVALATFALAVGIVTTFISSDHILSLSGMGVFWIALGGCLAQLGPAARVAA
ncbi:MAG: hypothetical protein BGO92_01155 [Magnetospirillum sp. 64-120]|nr:MAG: hypothetical protein BGO92_01155 [Magnetospirillum sp. 64-120]